MITPLTCNICLENTNVFCTDNKRLIAPRGCCDKILRCNHVFHNACIKKWYEMGVNGQTCPTCRKQINFRNHGLYYFDLLKITNEVLIAILKVINEYKSFHHIDTFIYFDNAISCLYIWDKQINCFHVCSWYLISYSFKN